MASFTVTPNTTEINVGEVIIFTISNTIGYKYRIYSNNDIIEENTITSTHTLQYTFLDAGIYNITAKEFNKVNDSWQTISNINITITVTEASTHTGSWSINNKTVQSLHIGNKEIQTIERVSDGAIIYQRKINTHFMLFDQRKIVLLDENDNLIPNKTIRVCYNDGTSCSDYTTNADNPVLIDGPITSAIFNSDNEYNGCSATITSPLTLTFTGSRFTPYSSSKGLTGSNMVIDWGDGTSESITSQTKLPSHTYSTSETHTIKVIGEVTSIGNYCFYGCTGLTGITIPNSIISLGTRCFYSCTGLTSIAIPNSVTSLGTYCFGDCTKLIDYQLYWQNPPRTWATNLMPNYTNTYYTIPYGTTANYVAKGFPSAKLIERSA